MIDVMTIGSGIAKQRCAIGCTPNCQPGVGCTYDCASGLYCAGYNTNGGCIGTPAVGEYFCTALLDFTNSVPNNLNNLKRSTRKLSSKDLYFDEDWTKECAKKCLLSGVVRSFSVDSTNQNTELACVCGDVHSGDTSTGQCELEARSGYNTYTYTQDVSAEAELSLKALDVHAPRFWSYEWTGGISVWFAVKLKYSASSLDVYVQQQRQSTQEELECGCFLASPGDNCNSQVFNSATTMDLPLRTRNFRTLPLAIHIRVSQVRDVNDGRNKYIYIPIVRKLKSMIICIL